MKIIKIALLGLGFFVLYLTIQNVGFVKIVTHIAELKWKILPLFLFYPFIFAFNALGWAYSYPKPLPKKARFRDIFAIRIIGETLNTVIPWAASLGGEPLKAELLKKRAGVPLSNTYASFLTVHTTYWTSMNIFILSGLWLSARSMPLSPLLFKSVWGFLAVLAIGTVFLFLAMWFGIFSKMESAAKKIRFFRPMLEGKTHHFVQLDQELKDYYLTRQGLWRFFLSSFYNFLAWTVGVFETFYLANILGITLTLSQAWLLEALIQAIRVGTFFIPASVGTQEGGIVLIFSELGLFKPLGLAFALLRRIREIFWIGIGLIMWVVFKEEIS